MTKEEAIEIYNGLTNPKIKEAFEFFIPELAESEDERIRMFILTSLNYLIGLENSPGSDYDKQLKEAYSWLKKQKDVISAAKQKGYEEGLEDGLQMIEKQKEWNITELSEEDKNRFNNLCSVIDESESWNDVSKQAFKNWLKFLCSQSKQKWNKEDESMIRFYEMDYNNQIGDWPTKKVVEMRLAFKNWLHSRLKFIRPQSYLKPNEVVDKNNVGSLIENKSK